MDIFLLIITIVSLAVAVITSVVAWRLARDERARTTARIAALAAAASEDQLAPQSIQHTEVAVRPSPWRVPEPTMPRALTAPPRAATSNEPLAQSRHEELPFSSLPDERLGTSFLGSAVAAPPSGSRQRGLAIAACMLFVAIVTGGYFTIYGKDSSGALTAAGQNANAAPLELISLRHERQSGALAITGLVRNPSMGTGVERLTAVVFLFDAQGGFLTSSRAGVDFTKLSPGDESPFVIRVESAPVNVARYRVSFRTDAGVVPHIDRRGQGPIAKDLP